MLCHIRAVLVLRQQLTPMHLVVECVIHEPFTVRYATEVSAADYVAVSRIDDDAQRKREMQQCHERGAQRLLDLCFANSGVYIKFAQHIGQLV